MAELTPAQRQYIRKRTTIHEPDPSETAGELNIVPFLDVVVNIIMFLLATSLTITYFQISSDLPEYGRGGGGGGSAEKKLNLSITIASEGVIVTGSGGKLAPGCDTTAGGRVITVPKRGKDYAWDELTKCVSRVKKQFPDEEDVIVTADPLIQYEHVVKAMDAVRSDQTAACKKCKDDDVECRDKCLLFPRVLISAGVR